MRSACSVIAVRQPMVAVERETPRASRWRQMRRWTATALLTATSLTMGSAFADGPGPIVVGKLLLDLRGPDAFVYGATVEALKTVSVKDRTLVFPTSTKLAKIGPVGQAAFLDKPGKEWIGINSNGIFSGRNQVGDPPLSVQLVDAADGGIVPPYWSEMKLQFNTKQNAVVDMTLWNDSTQGSTYRLYSGLSIVNGAGAIPPLDPNNPFHISCAAGADSSPDSDQVNCILPKPIVEDADKVVFTTRNGDWSLGGENSVNEFVFEKEPTGVIDCGDKTVAVGDGITLPFAQCTRLDNAPSSLPGGEPTGDNCEVVNYSLEVTSEASGLSTVTILYGLNGSQDESQFRFLCTVNWDEEAMPFGTDGLSNLQLTYQYWSPDNILGNRRLDYCPDSQVTTSPADCEPGTVTITGSDIEFLTANSIDAPSGLDAFQTGDVVALTSTTNNGIYTVQAASATSLTVTPALSVGGPEAASITRLSGCEITEFDLGATPDQAPTVPGLQRGCLFEEIVTQCNSSGTPSVCLQQTYGIEGDQRLSRF